MTEAWPLSRMQGLTSSTSTPPVDTSSTQKVSAFPALMSLPPRFCLPQEQREQAILHLRDDLSSVPFHAKKAAKEEAETGDPLAYWRDLYGSAQYRMRPPGASSTVDPIR